MKILVATSRTQGARPRDYTHCVDGELVWIQEPCYRDKMRMPSSCGCGRSFAGTASHRGTTTAIVADVEMSMDDYVLGLRTSLTDGGWPGEWAEDIALELTELASGWDTDAVIERDLDVLRERMTSESTRD